MNIAFSDNNACSGSKNYTAPESCLPCDLEIEGNGFYCIGENLVLEAISQQGLSFQWIGPGSFSSDEPVITITDVDIDNSGIYTVVVSGNNCVTTQPFLVEVADVPTPQAVQVGLEVCQGEPLFLSAQNINEVDYLWTGPNDFSANIRNVQILPATTDNSGWYFVSVSQNGCPGRPDSVLVQVNPLPEFTIIGPDQINPNNPALITIETENNYTYLWTITGNTFIIDTLIYSESNDSLLIQWNPTNGSITVRIRAIDELGCVSPITSHTVLVDFTTQIQNLNAIPAASVFPNPVSNELFLNPPADLNTPIQIVDITGKLIWSCNTCEQPIQLDLIQSGVYIIRYKYQQNIIQARFIKD